MVRLSGVFLYLDRLRLIQALASSLCNCAAACSGLMRMTGVLLGSATHLGGSGPRNCTDCSRLICPIIAGKPRFPAGRILILPRQL